MAPSWRIKYEGALYHVLSRGKELERKYRQIKSLIDTIAPWSKIHNYHHRRGLDG